MPQQTLSVALTQGSETFNLVQTVVDAQSRSVDETLAANAVNTEVDIVLTRAQIKSLMITSIGGDLTIKTNSTGAPDNTVVMTAGQTTVWQPAQAGVQAFGADPFAAADVTKLYLSSTAGTKFQLRAIVTSTNG